MSYETQHNAIRLHLANGWGTKTAIAWPNRKFDPVAGQPWIRLTILDGDARQLSIGGSTNLYGAVGIAMVGVFIPEGEGDKRALELADDVCALFSNANIKVDGLLVRFGMAKASAGFSDGHGWYQINVIANFTRSGRI